jgi:hypothetical protein
MRAGQLGWLVAGAWWLAIGAVCASASPADFERIEHKGDIEWRLVLETDPASPRDANPPAVRLSGEILTIELTGPVTLDVTAPESLVQTKGCAASKLKPDEMISLPGDRRRWRRTYRLEPERPGPLTLQLAEISARTANGTQVIAWPPLPVTIVTSIRHPSPDELIEDLPLPPFDVRDEWTPHVPAWLAASFLAVGFLTIGFVRYRQASRFKQEDPDSWLRRRVNELRAQNLGESEQIARFYGDLADLFRYYMERRFALPAPSRTSREFLGDLQKSPGLDPGQRELLERFLHRCDLVKFARESPSTADCDAAIELVLRFVDEGVRNAAQPKPLGDSS